MPSLAIMQWDAKLVRGVTSVFFADTSKD